MHERRWTVGGWRVVTRQIGRYDDEGLIKMGVTADIVGKPGLRLRIGPSGAIGKAPNLVTLGDPEIDKHLHITGGPEAVVRAIILRPHFRDRFLAEIRTRKYEVLVGSPFAMSPAPAPAKTCTISRYGRLPEQAETDLITELLDDLLPLVAMPPGTPAPSEREGEDRTCASCGREHRPRFRWRSLFDGSIFRTLLIMSRAPVEQARWWYDCGQCSASYCSDCGKGRGECVKCGGALYTRVFELP